MRMLGGRSGRRSLRGRLVGLALLCVMGIAVLGAVVGLAQHGRRSLRCGVPERAPQ